MISKRKRVKSMRGMFGLLIIGCLADSSVSAQERLVQPPTSIKTSLTKRYPGWHFPVFTDEVTQFFERDRRAATPYLIKGDFDGDGKSDFAVLIVQGRLPDAYGVRSIKGERLIVFLKKAHGYRLIVLEHWGSDPEVYITLARKGQKGYNLKTGRTFRYALDDIEFSYFAKAGHSYVYYKRRFRRITTGD
jgi:hypothetical protein